MNPSLFESLSDYDAQELKGGILPDQTLNPSEFFFEDNTSINQGFNYGTYVKNTDPDNRLVSNPATAYGVIGGTNYGLKNKAQIPE